MRIVGEYLNHHRHQHHHQHHHRDAAAALRCAKGESYLSNRNGTSTQSAQSKRSCKRWPSADCSQLPGRDAAVSSRSRRLANSFL
jgi:hypothetical protein